MLPLIILLILCPLSWFGVKYFYNTNNGGMETVCIIVCVITSVWIIVHIILWSLVGVQHDIRAVKHHSFQEAIDITRTYGYENETATLIFDITRINERLAADQMLNDNIWFDWCIDDRVMDLKPIK